jgi:ankyrin repeat protein
LKSKLTSRPAPARLRRRLLVAGVVLGGSSTAAPAIAQSARPIDELLRAIRRDDANGVRTALLRGADPNARDQAGTPVIVLAAANTSWNAVRSLADLQATQLDAANREGATALMYAALHGERSVVEHLVGRKAAVNRAGWAPLHFAAANGHAEVIRFLLEQHAYIDAESPNGTTPLMMAARQGHPTAVQLLVAEGADPTPRNQAGLDAAGYARAGGDAELADWLTARAAAFRAKYGGGGAK